MSNVSSGSSGTTSGRSERSRERVYGVPKQCWCGEGVTELTSKTNQNPCRRFFRCVHAAAEKLRDDNHTFKWVDEALVNEIEALTLKSNKLEKEVSDMKEMIHKKFFDKLHSDVEKMVIERLDIANLEAKSTMRMTMTVIVALGCVILYGCNKFVG